MALELSAQGSVPAASACCFRIRLFGSARQLSFTLCAPKVSRAIPKAQASEAFYHLESQAVGRHEKSKKAITKTGYRIGRSDFGVRRGPISVRAALRPTTRMSLLVTCESAGAISMNDG